MLKKISNIFENFILVLIVIGFISMGISYFLTGSGTVYGFKVMYVPTTSMEPNIHEKQLILAKTITASEVKEGDIVVYVKSALGDYENPQSLLSYFSEGKGDTYYVVHRIYKENADGSFLFKGDNNKLPDLKEVRPEQIKYKVLIY